MDGWNGWGGGGREGGREGGRRERGREGGREGEREREGGREGGRERVNRGREGGREGGRETYLIGRPKDATATVAAATQAAPPMSALMSAMLALGLMDMPPVSNVTPA